MWTRVFVPKNESVERAWCSLADGKVREGICLPGEILNPAPPAVIVREEKRRKIEEKLMMRRIFVVKTKPNFSKVPAFFSEKGGELVTNGVRFLGVYSREKSFRQLRTAFEVKKCGQA